MQVAKTSNKGLKYGLNEFELYLLDDGKLDDTNLKSEYERGFVDCWNKYVK